MGALFALFAGFYYWSPKILGKPYNELLGQIHFWALFIGVNITFMPMHFLGLAGQPRRIADYPDAYAPWNLIASFGSVISLVATLVFLYLLYDQLSSRVQASSNYWSVPSFFDSNVPTSLTSSAPTLEWLLTSPAPFHHFNELPLS